MDQGILLEKMDLKTDMIENFKGEDGYEYIEVNALNKLQRKIEEKKESNSRKRYAYNTGYGTSRIYGKTV